MTVQIALAINKLAWGFCISTLYVHRQYQLATCTYEIHKNFSIIQFSIYRTEIFSMWIFEMYSE